MAFSVQESITAGNASLFLCVSSRKRALPFQSLVDESNLRLKSCFSVSEIADDVSSLFQALSQVAALYSVELIFLRNQRHRARIFINTPL